MRRHSTEFRARFDGKSPFSSESGARRPTASPFQAPKARWHRLGPGLCEARMRSAPGQAVPGTPPRGGAPAVYFSSNVRVGSLLAPSLSSLFTWTALGAMHGMVCACVGVGRARGPHTPHTRRWCGARNPLARSLARSCRNYEPAAPLRTLFSLLSSLSSPLTHTPHPHTHHGHLRVGPGPARLRPVQVQEGRDDGECCGGECGSVSVLFRRPATAPTPAVLRARPAPAHRPRRQTWAVGMRPPPSRR